MSLAMLDDDKNPYVETGNVRFTFVKDRDAQNQLCGEIHIEVFEDGGSTCLQIPTTGPDYWMNYIGELNLLFKHVRDTADRELNTVKKGGN